jgi:outer membrane protein OmpA-like peptidoglycan-associated protein
MKKVSVFIVIVAVIFSNVLVSCEATKNANNTQKGAGIGAIGGALIGGIIGNNTGLGTAGGALIGAAIGGGTGALIGKNMDKQAREIETALPGAQVERVGEGIRLVLGENAVRFDTSKSTLTATAKANLDKLVPVFNQYPDTNIQIFGYTDSTGSEEFNLRLSEQRAISVEKYLESKGLNMSRFKMVGMGIADPIATNETPEGRSQNRRVEFAITANEKMVQDAQKQSGK